MKHKLLFGFATAAMAAVMCVGFAACGGGPNAKSVKGEEITEEQWGKFTDYFEKEDAKYTIETSVETKSDDGSGTTLMTFTQDGAKSYYKVEVNGKVGDKKVDDVSEVYVEKKDGAYVVYEKGEDGKWTSEEEGYSPVDYMSTLGPISEMASTLLSYSAFEYSADQKGYVLKNAPEGTTSPVLKFDKDGRLVAIYYSYEVEQGSMEFNLVVDYDAKGITLPTVG